MLYSVSCSFEGAYKQLPVHDIYEIATITAPRRSCLFSVHRIHSLLCPEGLDFVPLAGSVCLLSISCGGSTFSSFREPMSVAHDHVLEFPKNAPSQQFREKIRQHLFSWAMLDFKASQVILRIFGEFLSNWCAIPAKRNAT